MFKNISHSSSTSLDNICYVVSNRKTQDDIGNWITSDVKTMLYCAELPAHSSEFFSAGKIGIKPEAVLLVDSESYSQEERVLYNDTPHIIYRHYPRPDGFTELYLKRCDT